MLGKQDALSLRTKLGFADSFPHGRLGFLVLKQLSEHAYGRTAKLPAEPAFGLQMMMMQRLSAGVPRVVSAKALRQWFVYTDAACEPELMSGGVGAAIFNDACECVGWFGFPLDTAVPALWCW